MRTTREDLDGENTKTNVSVSSAMQPHCISMLAVYTEYASGTQNTCRNRSREDCTLSRVEGVAQTRSREVVLRPRSASRKNRMSSCCRRNVQCAFPLTNTMIPRSCSLPNIGWSSVAPLDHFLSSKKSRNVRPWSGCRWLHGTNGL